MLAQTKRRLPYLIINKNLFALIFLLFLMSRKTDNRIKNAGASEVYVVEHFNKKDHFFIQVTKFS